MAKADDYYTLEAIRQIMADNSTVTHEWDESDVAALATTKIQEFRSYAMDELSRAEEVVLTGLMGPDHIGLRRGARTRMKEAKKLMAEARRDLDRMAFWDSILSTAKALMEEERVYQEGGN